MLAILTTLCVLLTSCTGGSSTTVGSLTPDVETTTLLPATPVASTVPLTPEAIPSPTALDASTPLGPSLACIPQRTRFAQLLLPLAFPEDLARARDLASVGELGALGLLGFPGEGLAAQLEAIQQASFVPVLIASDEEGGQVQRLAELLGPIPSAASQATTRSPADVEALWVEYGSRVDALGIDVVLGPVVDVGGAPGIGSRSFGDDPAAVSQYGLAVTEGLLAAGITPVLKHFPGHGRASGDSHFGLPVVPTLDDLWANDLVPYVDIVGDHQRDQVGVMIGHLSVPDLTGDLPTSLSPEVVNGLLRNEVGFGGLVFTDSLNMQAVTDNYGMLDAIERSILAGSDIVILGSLNDLEPAIDHLVSRAAADPGLAGLLGERVERVMAAKGQSDICSGAQ